METYRSGCIYLLTNKITGKKYVGQSIKGAERRFREHVACAAAGVDTVLYRSMRKHGADNFNVEVLQWCSEPLLNFAERYHVQVLGSLLPAGYNSTKGGDGGGYGYLSKSRRKEIGAKIVAASSGRRSAITKAHFSSERGNITKKAIADKLSGRKLSKRVCRNHSDGLRRRYTSDEEREKTSQAGLSHYRSNAGIVTKLKLSEAGKKRASTGAYFSETTKQKLRDMAKAQWTARKAAGYARLGI